MKRPSSDIILLAQRCGIDADVLDDRLTLCKQGYECLIEDLEEEPDTKDGGRILKRLQSLVNAASPDLKRIQQQLKKVETMRVWIRTYPVIEGPLVDRILQSNQLNKDDLESLRLNVAHIIKQDRSRSTRGGDTNAQDALIIEFAGIWLDLKGTTPNYSTKEGAFLDFAQGAAGIITGADAESIPNRFRRITDYLNDHQDAWSQNKDTDEVLEIRARMLARIERNKERG